MADRNYDEYFMNKGTTNNPKTTEEQPKRATKEHRRYIGKIKEHNGKNGPFQSIWADNNDPTSQYFQGELFFKDKDGKTFKVKQLGVGNVNEQTKARGFSNSIYLDLDSEYHVED